MKRIPVLKISLALTLLVFTLLYLLLQRTSSDRLRQTHLDLDSILAKGEGLEQPAIKGNYFARAEKAGKHGCLDTNGREIIPFIYDEMGFWGDGLIAVNSGAKKVDEVSLEGGLWGYCNERGKLVIPHTYEKAETFHDGFAAVLINGKWGFIDTLGKIVIAPEYEEVHVFSEGLCGVNKSGLWAYIDKTGKPITTYRFGEIHEFVNGIAAARVGIYNEAAGTEDSSYYTLIDKSGKQLVNGSFEMIWWFRNGLVKSELKDSVSWPYTKKGFLNRQGKTIVPFIYDDAEDMCEGIAVVGIKKQKKNKYDLSDEYRYGYVDSSGREIIKPQFGTAGWFRFGTAVVSRERRIGTFTMIMTSETGYISNHKDLPKYAAIDKSGNYILGYDWRALESIGRGLFIAERARYNYRGLINIKGDTLIPFEYEFLSYSGQGLFLALKQGEQEWVLLDKNNNLVFHLGKLDLASHERMQFGLIKTKDKTNTKYGFVNKAGRQVVLEQYDMIYDFEPARPGPWNKD